MRVYAPLVGAAVALVIGVWLAVSGIDYARNGCDCDEPWYPDWIWVAMIGLAATFFAAAIALIVRFVRGPES
jgi:hypothetical protein